MNKLQRRPYDTDSTTVQVEWPYLKHREYVQPPIFTVQRARRFYRDVPIQILPYPVNQQRTANHGYFRKLRVYLQYVLFYVSRLMVLLVRLERMAVRISAENMDFVRSMVLSNVASWRGAGGSV